MRFKIETLNRFLTKPLALLIALAVAPFAFAQTAPPQSAAGDSDGKTSKGAVMKGKAPINRETLRIKLPKPQEATLPNGLQIVL
ncbi:MAG TPA: hypothetical protein VK308_15020, partial [Pyrinomonadaceae bacterium]|nr:hypothetical protein [Pyrinomonadaceae bacterium]